MAVATTRDQGSAGTERRSGSGGQASRPRKALTIGAVCKILSQEFDDISISKIRYLEDQKLLAPRRTPGGDRLYSQADVERLRATLRMQRYEFLPLRVIRQELASGDFTGPRRGSEAAATRRATSVDASVSTMTLEEILDEAGVSENLIRELQEYGIVQTERRDGRMTYDETDLEIVRAAAELSRSGAADSNIRVFGCSTDREAALLQQSVGPGQVSRSKARRKEAIENLESLAAVCGHLKHLLLVRDLRRIKGD